MADIYFIAAIDEKNGLAKAEVLPWDLPSDRAYFREKVAHGPVVMGQKTYESNKKRPFGTGANYVLSHTRQDDLQVQYIMSIEEVLEHEEGPIWVIGGGQIFTLLLPWATRLYITQIEGDFGCDVFFPEFKNEFNIVSKSPHQEENGYGFWYEVYERASAE